ncbi:MAG: GIY-YIG nuclease family protein [Candidatus Saccharibacteria bacterium]|nr:GIY-YIG nuclease family protein [Candidatus Saccharibacteria bacterium]
MYYVYLLKLGDGSIYTGSTNDLQKRVSKHSKGDVLATKGKRPVELIYYCSFVAKSKALEFEKYLKTESGQAFRNKRLI